MGLLHVGRVRLLACEWFLVCAAWMCYVLAGVRWMCLTGGSMGDSVH